MKKLYAIFTALFLTATLINVTAQEMVQGGDMETESTDFWTIVDIAPGDGHFEEFGYTADTPSGGEGGCLAMSGLGNWNNAAVCQEITLEKGVQYILSLQVKTSMDFILDNNWLEIVAVPTMPRDGEDGDITAYPNLLALNSWDCPDVLSVDGNLGDFNCDAKSPRGDTLNYAGTGDTTIVLVLKVGAGGAYDVVLDNVSLMGPEAVAVESATLKTSNKVYPNPATDQIRISNVDAAEIQIFDVTGKKIFSTSNVSDEMTIDISDYADGMYFLRAGKSNTIFIKQ